MLKMLGAHLERACVVAQVWTNLPIAVRNIPFFQSLFVLPLPFLSFRGEELRDGTASPLRGLVLHQYP